MTKTLRKAIMQRSKFKNLYNEKRTVLSWENYKRQRNYCVNLLRRSKKSYFGNLNVKNLTDNRKFWKSIKPYFSKKGVNSNKLMLKENDHIVSDEKQLAQIMNSFFVNITSDVNITSNLELKNDIEENKDISLNLENILEYFNNHSSLEKIKEYSDQQKIFSFRKLMKLRLKK